MDFRRPSIDDAKKVTELVRVSGMSRTLERGGSFKEEGTRAKSAFAGSFSEMQRNSRSELHSLGTTSKSSTPVETLGTTSMSSAAVETLVPHEPRRRQRTSQGVGWRFFWWLLRAAYSERARNRVPADVLLFLFMLGVGTGVLGTVMELTIELISSVRVWLLGQTLQAFNEWRPVPHVSSERALRYVKHGCMLPSRCEDEAGLGGIASGDDDSMELGCVSWACTWAHAGIWLGHTLLCCWLAIFLTAKIAPAAAGSGIPEMKSILTGGMKSQEASYLSLRTLCAKILGLVLALGAGLPLGKEGPSVHISCCLVMALLNYTPLFSSIRRSKPQVMQMLAVGCAVGVSSTFGGAYLSK